jgi:CRISPR-associated protein Csm4
MTEWRLRIVPRSPWATPWTADTVFGHLAWAVAREGGDREVGRFLEPFAAGEPPFVISDGLPGDLFPAPPYAGARAARWLTRRELADLVGTRRDVPSEALGRRPFVIVDAARLTVERRGAGSALERATEQHLAAEYRFLSVYLRALDGWPERVHALFELVAQTGYGRRKSAGRGAFSVEAIEPAELRLAEEPDGFVALSGFTPARGDPIDGAWRFSARRGALGEESALGGDPFKRPLGVIEAGAAFRTGVPPRPYYGRMIPGIASQRPEVMQYGYCLAAAVHTTRRTEEVGMEH